MLALVAHWSFMLRFGSINSLLYNIRIQCFHRSGIIFRQNFFKQMKSIDKLLQNSNDEKIVGDIVLCDFRSFFLFLVRMTSTNRGVATEKLIVFPFYTGTVCVSELNILRKRKNTHLIKKIDRIGKLDELDSSSRQAPSQLETKSTQDIKYL